MSTWLTVVLLGLLEGLTEFLPISSTGHLLLAEVWLPRQSDVFNVVIQVGAVLAVLPLFKTRLRQLAQAAHDVAARQYAGKLLLAFGCTAVGGLVLKKLHLKLPESILPVALATGIGGILFLLVEHRLQQRPAAPLPNLAATTQIGWRLAAAIGLAQLLAAVFPGTSRSGSTILLALVCGVTRPAAAEFSFLLGIPTLLAAAAVELASTWRHPTTQLNSGDWQHLLLACGVAALSAFVVVRWLLGYIQHHSFKVFGWYRIVLSGLMLWWQSR